MAQPATERATCCIVGGGPAGAVLGLLLARAGLDVTVLEKHSDFLRDFRGDTIHASTIELMDELGLAERFLELPHQVAPRLEAIVNGQRLVVADFNALGGPYPHILFMPQWDFLDFITSEARRYPGFRLLMEAEATDIIREAGRVAGVVFHHGGGEHSLRATLTVACDGRDSVMRERARLAPREFGAPMDVLWFRLPRTRDDPEQTGARIQSGAMMIMINRGDYWQTAYVIPKGGVDEVRAGGLEAFRRAVAGLAPFVDEARVATLASWDAVKMLRVQVNRLPRWHVPGLLFIGDAAHAMSPVGGVGINLAVQDAIAAARLLAEPLNAGRVTERHLARVQRRRWLPTVATQGLQRVIQRRVIRPVIGGEEPVRPPRWLPRLLALPPVRWLVARAIAVGIRPEHIG